VLPLAEIMSRIKRGESLPKNTAAITFDDGLENNFTYAYPLLQRLLMPATIFLVSDFVGTNNLLWFDRLYVQFTETTVTSLDLRKGGLDVYALNNIAQKQDAYNVICEHLKIVKDEDRKNIISLIERQLHVDVDRSALHKHFRLMSWEQRNKMKKSGLVDFGSHSSTHPILSRLSNSELYYEIQNSFSRIGDNPVLFAYPNGRAIDFDERCQTFLSKKNIACAVSTISGLNDRKVNPYALRRISVGSDISMEYFRLVCSGMIDFLKRSTNKKMAL
jgi:peptidoglycan/xylan/chitin deacetylase (PgdA/CDA1 family)